MAYAHAKGVIHRNLMPANLMVGAFGEVQVMDWGLAKVLAEGGIADEERACRGHQTPEDVTTIRTARSTGSAGGFGTDTEAGSILGTPVYMPPEQARGDIALLDRRADVFGLGAILCEILTGKPPYLGRSSEEVRRKAANGDQADATTRLDACGAYPELTALTKKGLSPEAIDRPKDAQEVADGLSAYMASVQERLQEAERERAVAVAKAIEEQQRRKLQVGLAAAALALTTVGGLSTTYYVQQRQARAATVARTLGEATTLRDQARHQPDDPEPWQVALAAIRRVEDVLGSGGDPETQRQLNSVRDEVRAGRDGAERDRRFLDRLVDIRSAKSDDHDGSTTDTAYASLSREGWILSLSNWDDEKALVRWRTQAKHHEVQEKGREEVLLDYHLRVGQLTRDTRPPQGHALREQRLDETETDEGTTVVPIDAKRPKEWVEKSCHEDVARYLGIAPEAQGLTSWDVFDSVLTPGEVILLSSWRDHGAAEAFEAATKLPEGARLRRIRVVRDYGMFDRRESPQYYPDAKRPS